MCKLISFVKEILRFVHNIKIYSYISGLRLVNLFKNDILYEFTDLYNKESEQSGSAETLKTKLVLIHDAIFVLYKGLSKINVTISSLSCNNAEAWFYGSSLITFMKTVCIVNFQRKIHYVLNHYYGT